MHVFFTTSQPSKFLIGLILAGYNCLGKPLSRLRACQVRPLDGKIVIPVNLDRPRVHARQTITHHSEPSAIFVSSQRPLIQVQEQTNLCSAIARFGSFPVSQTLIQVRTYVSPVRPITATIIAIHATMNIPAAPPLCPSREKIGLQRSSVGTERAQSDDATKVIS